MSVGKAKELTEFLMKSLGMAGFDREVYYYLQDLIFFHKMELEKQNEFIQSKLKQNQIDQELKLVETLTEVMERMK